MSTIKTISHFSMVARQDTYRIMTALQKMGLVEKIITTPTMFKAIPMKNGLSILMSRRVQETLELQTKTRELLRDFKSKNLGTDFQDKDSQFILVPGEKRGQSMLRDATENTQTSWDGIATWDAHKRVMAFNAENFRKALNRGVKVRTIIEKPRDEETWQEIAKDLKKNPYWNERYVLTPPPAVFMISDKKKVLLCTEAIYTRDPPILWSDNPHLSAIIQEYFEMMWRTAMEEIPEEH